MLALLEAGARQAGPGEFTKRAFLNGKMDLAMAEAVGDLIQAQSEAAHRVALNQMRGGVSKKLAYLRQQLVDLAALLELELDFGEEDVAFANRDTLKQILTDIRQEMDGLIGSFITGKMIKEGVQVVIVGKPNAGKSTLLNTLVQEEKAIVTAQEGTTRDLIEEVAEIFGVLFRFFDTAGLRQGTDEVELIGIQRAKDKMLQADLVIYLFDATVTTAEMLDKELMQIPRDKRVLVVGNKIDLVTTDGDLPGRTGLVYISAKGKLHMDKLEKALVEAVGLDGYAQETMITSVRHTQALIEARKALEEVQSGLEGLVSSELLVQDLRIVMDAIGSITGEISPNEVLGAVFSRFCIGK
jgi:tRNA modification GTPase